MGYERVPYLPFARLVRPGEMFPAGHGLAWRYDQMDAAVTFPVPLNVVAGWLRDFWLDLTCPKALRDDVWGAGEHSAAFLRGVESGRSLASRGSR